jgi:Cof subfamily protein (haloacid dehalogenase superfamily)
VTAPSSLPPVVATDLDGTLVHSDGTVSDRSRTTLASVEDAGALLVLVTGRPPRWMAPIVEATGHRGLAICANGALVYDLHTERVVAEHLIDPVVAAEVATSLREAVPGVVFAVERGERGFAHEPAYRPGWDQADKVVGAAEVILAEPMAKLLARHPELTSDELVARASAALGDAVTVTSSSRDGLLEMSAAGVSKASTLGTLCAERGHAAGDVIAFGDMPNDIPMLVWAGHGVAVASAHPDVLAIADEVTASNDDDGVALVLERFL